MPGLKTKQYGSGDQTWCAAPKELANTRSEKLDISKFTKATHFPDGYIPSGTPVAKDAGVLVPYDPTPATTTGAGLLAGFVARDVEVTGDPVLNVALYDTGRVVTAKVPATGFTAPAAAKRVNTTIVFI